MLMLDTWEQTAVFNPSDPTQKKIEKYAGIPGQYATYYFNRVPNPGALKGLAMPKPFSVGGVIVYGLIGLGIFLGATRTKPGKKIVRKVKGLLPHRRK